MLVQGVEGDEGGLAYFGYSYYEQNKDKLNLVSVDAGSGCVKPTTETIQSGEYKPLSRPLFMYPSEEALKRRSQGRLLHGVRARQHNSISETAQIVPMSSSGRGQAQATLSAG